MLGVSRRRRDTLTLFLLNNFTAISVHKSGFEIRQGLKELTKLTENSVLTERAGSAIVYDMAKNADNADVTQRNIELLEEIRREVVQKTHQQRLWEKGEEDAILMHGYGHLARSPNVENRVLKGSDATKARKVVRKRGELWTTGDDGVWRKV